MCRLKTITRLLADSNGATAVEYGLVLALIVLAIIGSISNFGAEVGSTWNNIAQQSLSASSAAAG